jgi:manganese-dependent inorganic pyrophosphatase
MSYSTTEPLLVVGHTNPDTDAICSAIGQAAFLKASGYENVEAICCGDIPVRTRWVLEQAGLPAPRLVTDVRSNAGDLISYSDYKVCQKDTILTAYRTMVAVNKRSVPVVRNKQTVVGLLKLVDLLQLMMPTQVHGLPIKTIHASLENVLVTLEGRSVAADLPPASEEEDLVLFVAAAGMETIKRRYRTGDSPVGMKLTVCGDRPNVHKLAIEEGVRALVITGGFEIGEALEAEARKKGIAVIYCKYDTATTVHLIRCARCVASALTEDFVYVDDNEAVSSFKERITNNEQDIFPVVQAGTLKLMGSFFKVDLISVPRKKLVLVDHNEYSQAVKGVEEAQVVEVIDHHRLAGNVVSREPIAYLNEPVGSTSTLVARKFKYRGLTPCPGVALCLCAGIISDTLHLKSPTTTDLDVEILAWLCEIAGIHAEEFTKGFFEAGSLLLHGTVSEIIGMDRKEFKEGGVTISISQIEELVVDVLPSRIEEIRGALKTLVKNHGYDIAIIAITDISAQSSTILAAGSEKIANSMPFNQSAPGVWDAPGVVSRKMQIFPAMCEAIYSSVVGEVEAQ